MQTRPCRLCGAEVMAKLNPPLCERCAARETSDLPEVTPRQAGSGTQRRIVLVQDFTPKRRKSA